MKPERFRRIREVLDRRQPDLTVLMERVNKPHNLSAILRSCDAVGVLEAHAVLPKGGLKLDRETSAGSAKWIRVHRHESVEDAVSALKARSLTVVAAHPGEGATDYRELDLTRPTAFMMGAELWGIGERGLALADRSARIPTQGMVPSLNVSVAAALLLFEAQRQREAAGLYVEPRLDPERYRALAFEWAYPRVARMLRERGEPYPELDEAGRIVGEVPGR